MINILRSRVNGPSRRQRKVGMSVFLLAVLVMTFGVQSATAGRAWCQTDPVFLVDGQIIDVTVAGPLTAPLLVTGPTKIELLVPKGVKADVVISDLGFGRGYDISITESNRVKKRLLHTEVEVRVYVPASDPSMPVLVKVAPNALRLLNPETAEDTANSWIKLKVNIPN